MNINTKIIAEIANAHQGNVNYAIKLANLSILAGADAVKFQIYTANELLHKNHKRYEHFNNQSFNSKEWGQIFKSLKRKKAKIYCDVFGEESYKIAASHKVDGFKIHSSDLINKKLLELVSRENKKEFFLSTGGSTINEIFYAVSVLKKKNIKPTLMHGYQSYPTNINDTNLNRIKYFKKIFMNTCSYGYQDHISGDDEMNYIASYVAMALNLKFIEKHVTLSRAKKGIDYYSSIEPTQLKNFILKIRKIEKIFGNNIFTFSKNEKKYRKDVKKIWFIKKKIEKNQILKTKYFTMKRPPNNKTSPTFIENLADYTSKGIINAQESIDRSKLKIGVTAIIVARLKSKRLNNKVIKKINKETLIEHLFKRLKSSKTIDNIVLATTNRPEDSKLCNIAKKNNIHFFRGDEKNVLRRMKEASDLFNNDIIIRVTGDDVLIDNNYLDKLVIFHKSKNLDYSSNKKLPGGTEVEIFNKSLLNLLLKIIPNTDQTEYLTYYISRNIDQFNVGSLPVKKKHCSNKSLTLDTLDDFFYIKKFLNKMALKNKKYSYDMDDVLNFLNHNKKKKNIISRAVENIDSNLKWEKLNEK